MKKLHPELTPFSPTGRGSSQVPADPAASPAGYRPAEPCQTTENPDPGVQPGTGTDKQQALSPDGSPSHSPVLAPEGCHHRDTLRAQHLLSMGLPDGGVLTETQNERLKWLYRGL